MAMRSRPSDASWALAFTLVELLVSSAIMTVFVGIILYLATALLNSWNRATGILSTNYEARISLDYLAQDLAGAILRHDGDPWLISEDAENIEGIRNTVWLRFFTAAPDRDRREPGEVTAVSYRLLYLNPLNPSKATGKTAALYRTVINGRRTFEEFLGQLAVRAEEDFLPIQQGALSSSFLGGNIVSFRSIRGRHRCHSLTACYLVTTLPSSGIGQFTAPGIAASVDPGTPGQGFEHEKI